MKDIFESRIGYIILMAVHAGLGVLVWKSPMLFTFYLLGIIMLGVLVVYLTRDRGFLAGGLALYMIGMEISYRMGGATISWELGKYACVVVLIAGLAFHGRPAHSYTPFVLFIGLLLPSIALTTGDSFNAIREIIIFNLLGPVSLAVSGIYFFGLRLEAKKFWQLLRHAALPGITMLVFLFLEAPLSGLAFSTLESNTSAAGGFGPNQVSTTLGWFIGLFLLSFVHRQRLTPWFWTDLLLISLLTVRGLLTYSRGGMLAIVVAFTVTIILQVLFHGFSRQMISLLRWAAVSAVVLTGVFLYTNALTDNWLLYRYMGKDTAEVLGGIDYETSWLTGRERIIAGELHLFLEHPVMGVGVGMAQFHQHKFFGEDIVSHTEFTRILGEHGFLGVIALLIILVYLPANLVPQIRASMTFSPNTFFFIIAVLTMFHGATRLALPGVLLGFAMCFIKWDSPDTHTA